MCDMTYSCTSSGLNPQTWLIYMCHMTHSHVRHNTSIRVAWHDAFMCVTCHDSIHVCDVSQFQIAPALSPAHTIRSSKLYHCVTESDAPTYANIALFDAPSMSMRFCEYITIFDAAIMSLFNMPISRYSMRLLGASDSVNTSHITIFDAATISLFQMSLSRYLIRLLQARDSVNKSPCSMHLLCQHSICQYHVIQCGY